MKSRIFLSKIVDQHINALVNECKSIYNSEAMPPYEELNKVLASLDTLLYQAYIATPEEDIESIKEKRIAEIEDQLNRHRQPNDVNGNPRYAIHFNAMFSDNEYTTQILRSESVEERYVKAVFRAKKIGGKKFHNKSFGGGIIFQSYNTRMLAEQIVSLQKFWSYASFFLSHHRPMRWIYYLPIGSSLGL